MAEVAMHEDVALEVTDLHISEVRPECYKVRFITNRGDNHGLLHHREGNKGGTVLVSGSGGGLDGPASIYRDMGPDLLDCGISSLRLDYRKRNYLEECILDALMGIELLKGFEIERIGVAGWSFGGAVAIDAGIMSDDVVAVATVASQTYGTESVDRLAPKSLLLIHGMGDKTLPPACSQDIFRRAGEPKQIVMFEGANHGVDQKRDEMLHEIENFFVRELGTERVGEASCRVGAVPEP